jgi:hypothetical protein
MEGNTMLRFIAAALAFGIALSGPASAAQTVAGDIKADGQIVRGTGFTAKRTGLGTYYIEFPNGYFAPTGCASMVVEPSSAKPLTSDVSGLCQPHPYFRVIFFNSTGQTQDADFHFIVLQY